MDMENNWLLLEGAGLRGRQDGWRDSEVHTSIIKVTTHWGVTCSLATTVAVIVVKVAHSCLTLCRPMVYTVQGILQARILEWVAFPFSRGSSQPRDQTQVSRIAGGFFASWATREAQEYWSGWPIPSPPDLPNPGIKLGSPALQVDSLETELSGKPIAQLWAIIVSNITSMKFASCSHHMNKNYVTSYGDRW